MAVVAEAVVTVEFSDPGDVVTAIVVELTGTTVLLLSEAVVVLSLMPELVVETCIVLVP